MVMSCTGGFGSEMDLALRRLASNLAIKENSTYSEAIGVLRTKFAFSLARTALVCLRGSRSLWVNCNSTRNVDECDAPVALVASAV